jgi:predicted DNA-binding transcriptional regulator YafY
LNNNDDVQVFRQWMIPRTLAGRRFGMSVRELGSERKVVQKTIGRDLVLLLQLGFALVVTDEARGRKTWKLSQSDGCPPLRFTHDEAVALSMARRLLEPFRGAELCQAADRALRKIHATLSEQAQAHFKKLRCTFHFTYAGFGNDNGKAAIIDELTLTFERRNGR